MRTPFAALLTVSLLSACVDPGPDDQDVASGQEAITPGAPAVDWMVRRAGNPPPCTPPLIGRRYVLTALHCVWSGSVFPGHVRFYLDASGYDPSVFVNIKAVHNPPGTDLVSDRRDLGDRLADMAILELTADAPSTTVAAALAWEYPGDGAQGFIVGAGGHDGMVNPTGALWYYADHTDDVAADVEDWGEFHLQGTHVDGNDSGAPFYVDNRVTGVLLGHNSRDIFSSVPSQMPWILSTIGWTWTHGAAVTGFRTGTTTDIFTAESERVCQYACDRTSACDAYNYTATYDLCVLVQDPGDVVAVSFYRTALR